MSPKLAMTYSSEGGWGVPIGSVTTNSEGDLMLSLPGVAAGKIIAVGATLKTENESYVRIVKSALLDSFGQPCFYIVTDKGGTKYLLGGSPLGPIDVTCDHPDNNNQPGTIRGADSIVRVWLLTLVKDTRGNEIEFHYKDAVEVPRIMDVKWGHQLRNKLSFIYEADPEPVTAVLGGAVLDNDHRLASVQSFVGTDAISRWDLAYVQLPDSNVSFLQSIRPVNPANPADALPPTTFTRRADEPGQNTPEPDAIWQGAGTLDGVLSVVSRPHPNREIAGLVEGGVDIVRMALDGGLNAGVWGATTKFTLGLIRDYIILSNGRRQPHGLSTFAMINVILTQIFGEGSAKWWIPKTHSVTDMNGDGKVDRVLALGSKKWLWHQGTGDISRPFAPPAEWSGASGRWVHETIVLPRGASQADQNEWRVVATLRDFNGDGLPDFIRAQCAPAVGDSWLVNLNTGSGFGAARAWANSACSAGGSALSKEIRRGRNRYTSKGMFDVNGDGWLDAVNCHISGKRCHALINDRVGGFLPPAEFGPADQRYFQIRGNINIGGGDGTTRSLIDINQDGLPDWVWVSNTCPDSGAPSCWLVFLNSGGKIDDVSHELPGTDNEPWITNENQYETNCPQCNNNGIPVYDVDMGLQDLNGDGLLDYSVDVYLGPNYARFGTGWGFGPRVYDKGERLFWQGDLDQDGYSEIWQLQDIDNDGVAERVWDRAGNWDVSSRQMISFPDVVAETVNSHGGKTTITYTPSTAHPDTFMPLTPTVTAITLDDGMGNTYTTQYEYSGGRNNYKDRRSLGFAKVKTIYPPITTNIGSATGASHTVTEYLQNCGRGALVQKVTRYPGAEGAWANAIVTRNIYKDGNNDFVAATTDCTNFNNPKPYVTNKTKMIVTAIGADGSSHRTRSTDFSYDGFGNVTDLINSGEAGVLGDETLTHTRYVYNTGSYIVNKPRLVNVYKGTARSVAALLTKTRLYYDNNTSTLTAPTQGLLTSTRDMVRYSGEADQWATTTFEYDGGPTAASMIPGDCVNFKIGNLTKVTDPTGIITTTAYQPENCVYKKSESVGVVKSDDAIPGTDVILTTSYTWDEGLGTLLTRTDPNGRVLRNEYDAFGRLTGVYSTPPDNSNGAEIKLENFSYNTNVIPNRTEHTTYPGPSGVAPLITKIFIDGLDRVIEEHWPMKDAFTVSVTNRLYNHRGQVARATLPREAPNTDTFQGFDFQTIPALSPVKTTDYDGLGRVFRESLRNADGTEKYVTQTRYAPWTKWTIEPDYSDQRWLYYDGRGRLERVEEKEGTALKSTTRYHYDLLGNLTSYIDPNGNTTTMTYDSRGLRRSINDPNISNAAAGGVPAVTEYDLNGRVIRNVDAAGQEITLTLDELGRVTYKDYCPETTCSMNYDVITTYDAAGSLGRVATVDPVGGIGNEVSYTYDNWGRVTSETRRVYDKSATTQTEYDWLGRVTKTIYPSSSGSEPKGTSIQPLGGHGTVHGVNIRYLSTMGYHFQMKKDGFATELCGYFNGEKSVKLWHESTGKLLAEESVTNTVTSTRGGVWQCTVLTGPVFLKAGESYTVAAAMAGDGAIRRKDITFPTDDNSLVTVTSTTYCLGNHCRPTNSLTTGDNFGQADVRIKPAASVSEEVRYTYGYSGGVQSIDWYSGVGGSGSPQSQSIGKNAQYDALGRVTSIEWGNGLNTVSSFNNDYQKLESIEIANATGTSVSKLEYTKYWPDGNLREIVSSVGPAGIDLGFRGLQDDLGAVARSTQQGDVSPEQYRSGRGKFTERYEYDYANRLTRARHILFRGRHGIAWDWNYAYDAAGNLLSKSDSVSDANISYTYGQAGVAGPHAVTDVDGVAFTYDANGRMLSNGLQNASYAYNYDGTLRFMSLPDPGCANQTTNWYMDGNQTRTLKYSSNGCGTRTMIYTFGPHYEVHRKNAFQRGIEAFYDERYVLLNGAKIAIISDKNVDANSNVDIHYLHANHLGSPFLFTNSSGGIVGTRKYMPYGEVWEDIYESGLRYGFTGAEQSEGMSYLGVRELDNTLARMTNPDVIIPDIMNPQSLNRYAYAYNNPMRYTDLSGYAPIDPATIKIIKDDGSFETITAYPDSQTFSGALQFTAPERMLTGFHGLTHEEHLAIEELKDNPRIGEDVKEIGKRVFVRMFELPGEENPGKALPIVRSPNARYEVWITYNLEAAQEKFEKLGLNITRKQLIAHELGHIWANMRKLRIVNRAPFKVRGDGFWPKNYTMADALYWENAARGVGPLRLRHGTYTWFP